MGLIPGSGSRRSPGYGNGYPLLCSCLENSMDRGPWQAIQSMDSKRIKHDWATNTFTFFQTSPSKAHLLGGMCRGNWPLQLSPPPRKLPKVQKISYSVPRALKTCFCFKEHLTKNEIRKSVSLCISIETLPQYELHNIRLCFLHTITLVKLRDSK